MSHSARTGNSITFRDNAAVRPYEVLLVEDNSDDAQLFLHALQKVQIELDREIRTTSVSNGVDAAARILERKFDAIFLDVNLPPPDGVELTRRIRSSEVNRTSAVVILTGAEDRGIMGRAFQAGANLFLSKPIDRIRLLRLIQVSMAPIDRERRRLQRVKVRCKVTLQSGKDQFDGETADISLNGMLVRSNRILPVGSVVNVALTLESGVEPVRTAARVVRVTGNEFMALKMEGTGKVESTRLSEFLIPWIEALSNGDA